MDDMNLDVLNLDLVSFEVLFLALAGFEKFYRRTLVLTQNCALILVDKWFGRSLAQR